MFQLIIIRLKRIIYRLLRRSEKYTKTDMVYLAKGGFWLSLGQIISSVSTFLLAIAFANLLPKEVYGTYKYVLSLLGLLAISTLSGMGTAVTRAVAQGNDGSFLPALKLKIRWGLLGGLASLGLAGYYYLQGNIQLTFAFLITAIFIPFMDSFSLYGSLLAGKKRFDVSSKYGIFIKIIASLLIFITLCFTKNLLAILFIYLASYTLLRLIVLKLSLKYIENKKEDPESISYGKHLSLMNIISLIANQIDKILIFHFLGAGQLAVYSIAIALPEQIKGVLKNISNLALPKFSEKKSEEIKKTLYQKMRLFYIILLFIVIVYWLLAPTLFKLLFPQYLESVFYSQIFTFALLNIPVVFLCTPFLQSQALKNKLYKIKSIGSIVQISLILILTYFYGLLGLIIARILFRYLLAVFYLIEMKKV